MEAISCAKMMGIKTVYTEHSCFNYNDAAGINLNKIIKFFFREVDAAVAVSVACKENLTLRCKIDPSITFIIPNAVDTTKFKLKQDIRMKEPEGVINIVYVSRLMYRKGVDLLIGIIPKIIAMYNNVNFIIGGDGDKKLIL